MGIPTRPLGGSGVAVTTIGFGGAPLGDLSRAGSDDDALALLEGAWDAGIRYFDTAPFYGSGLSERRLGDFLRTKLAEEFVISSKVGRLLVPDRAWALEKLSGDRRGLPFRPVFDYSYDAIMRSYEQSLQRLGLEKIDVLLLHDIGSFSQGDRHEETMKIAMEGGLKALQSLKAQGAIRAFGIGVNEWEVCAEAMTHANWDCFLLAGRYTLLDQAALELFLPKVLEANSAIIIGGPLNSGILGSGPVPGARYNYGPAPEWVMQRVAKIQATCHAHDVSMPGAALAFPLGHPAIATILPGFATTRDLIENLRLLRTPIPDALWSALRAEGLLEPGAPIPRTPIL